MAVELVLRPQVLNTEGTLQGALVALLVERAAECLAESRLGMPQRIAELDLRYLRAATVGPVRSWAAFVGAPEVGMLRVELLERPDAEQLQVDTAGTLKEIAAALYIGTETVKTHLTSVYRKMGVSSRAEATSRTNAPTAPATSRFRSTVQGAPNWLAWIIAG